MKIFEKIKFKFKKENLNLEKESKKSKIPFKITPVRIAFFLSIFIASISIIVYFNKENIYTFAIKTYTNSVNEDLAKLNNSKIGYETIDLNLKTNNLNFTNFFLINNNSLFFVIKNINIELIKDKEVENKAKLKLIAQSIELQEELIKEIKLNLYELGNDIDRKNVEIFIGKLKELSSDSIFILEISNNDFIDGKIHGLKNKLTIDNPYFKIELYIDIKDFNIETNEININNIIVKFKNKKLDTLFEEFSPSPHMSSFEFYKLMIKTELLNINPNLKDKSFFINLFNKEKDFYLKLEKEQTFGIEEILDILYEKNETIITQDNFNYILKEK